MYDSASIPLPPPTRRDFTLLETGRKMAKGQAASKRKGELDTSSSDTLYQRKAISRASFLFSELQYLYTIFKNTLRLPFLTKNKRDFSFLIVEDTVPSKFSEIYMREIEHSYFRAFGAIKIILPLSLDLLGSVKRYPFYDIHY